MKRLFWLLAFFTVTFADRLPGHGPAEENGLETALLAQGGRSGGPADAIFEIEVEPGVKLIGAPDSGLWSGSIDYAIFPPASGNHSSPSPRSGASGPVSLGAVADAESQYSSAWGIGTSAFSPGQAVAAGGLGQAGANTGGVHAAPLSAISSDHHALASSVKPVGLGHGAGADDFAAAGGVGDELNALNAPPGFGEQPLPGRAGATPALGDNPRHFSIAGDQPAAGGASAAGEVSTLNSVPEPAGLALFALAITALGLTRRRKA